MAFLGGIPGLGALAGGVEQGIGQGFNIDQYLNSIQSQNLAGNILSQAYGGQGGQGSSSPLSGLSNIVGGSAGNVGPGMGGSVSPTMPSGTGGTGPTVGNLFTPNPSQALPPGQPAVGAGLGSLAQGQGAQTQAQPQAPPLQPMQQPQFQPPQPFQTNQAQGIGGQNQLTLPQFVQMARKVNPNASGRQIMMAAGELAKGGLLGYGAMSPYQAAELAIRSGAERRDWEDLDRKIREGNERAQRDQEMVGIAGSREADTRAREADTEASRGVTEAEASVRDAKSALSENRRGQAEASGDIIKLNGQMEDQRETPEWADQMKEAKARLTELKDREKQLNADLDEAKKAHADAVTKRQEGAAKAAQSYGRGGDVGKGAGTEDDPVRVSTPSDAERLPPGTIYQTPDGQTMVR